MNDEARDVLARAALEGHPQAFGLWHNNEGGDCGQGVLHLTMHQSNRREAVACVLHMDQFPWDCLPAILQKYELDLDEWREIALRNDRGEDFLTIARKVGHGAAD